MATDSLPLVCDALFSLYLNSTYETFILKLTEMTQNPSPTINGLLESLSHYQISLGRKNTNGEINVFIAERARAHGIVSRFRSKIDIPISIHRIVLLCKVKQGGDDRDGGVCQQEHMMIGDFKVKVLERRIYQFFNLVY
ncbi:hypothetical protein NE237_011136 [Protea cynaroides]|uniref:Uncharacterized protein n=1 Tax=Protea cynaroides TaxID=273540 RepID=A0A9Q0GXC1_9MAGN|nr:hypothetical protein NE237_011136 [Protea cynaroides]